MSSHEIEIEYGERYTDFVMGMYVDTSLADDIDMLGWNLCDCDDVVFQVKLGNCHILSQKVRRGKAEIVILLDGNDEELQEQTIDDFIDGLGDFVLHQERGLQSRTG